jgi:hypothetical protein
VSYAGHQKEILLRGAPTEFNLKLGIALAPDVRNLLF